MAGEEVGLSLPTLAGRAIGNSGAFGTALDSRFRGNDVRGCVGALRNDGYISSMQ